MSTAPPDQIPIQPVENPVICNPYEEPTAHFLYKNGTPSKISGRRPASYWYRSQKTGGAQQDLFAEEERDDLPLINLLRADVKRWRESGYRGATRVTSDLLNHW